MLPVYKHVVVVAAVKHFCLFQLLDLLTLFARMVPSPTHCHPPMQGTLKKMMGIIAIMSRVSMGGEKNIQRTTEMIRRLLLILCNISTTSGHLSLEQVNIVN